MARASRRGLSQLLGTSGGCRAGPGLSDSEALQWLDGVRRTGLERRSTTPAVTAGQQWKDMENLAPLDRPCELAARF